MHAAAAQSQLVFHLEVADHHECKPSPSGSHIAAVKEEVNELCDPHTLEEQRLRTDVRVLLRSVVAEEGHADQAVLAARLAGLGYDVQLRTAVGGGQGTACFQNLKNVFLVVAPCPLSPLPSPPSLSSTSHRSIGAPSSRSAAPEPCIVDVNFPEHFEIPAPTPAFREVLAALPGMFVGPPSRLRRLVALVAAEMNEAFREQGMALPPWRKASAMLSKWLPERSKVRVEAPPAAASSGSSSPKQQQQQRASPLASPSAAAAAKVGGIISSSQPAAAVAVGGISSSSQPAAAEAWPQDQSQAVARYLASRLVRAAAACAEAEAAVEAAADSSTGVEASGASTSSTGSGDQQQGSPPALQRRRSLLSSSIKMARESASLAGIGGGSSSAAADYIHRTVGGVRRGTIGGAAAATTTTPLYGFAPPAAPGAGDTTAAPGSGRGNGMLPIRAVRLYG